MRLHRALRDRLNSPAAHALLACALVALPGCAVIGPQQPSTPPAQSAPRGDSAITSIVRDKLRRNTTVDAAAIGVSTRNGIVTLSGAARSATERTMAETLARSVSGVKAVVNDIVIEE